MRFQFISKSLIPVLIFIGFLGITQAQSDDCATATNLGVLPGGGGILCQNGTTIGATPAFPPYEMTGCAGGDITDNIPDVWYQFTASENLVNIDVTSLGNVINNPAITLWQDACNTGLILGCAVGINNNVSLNFEGLVVGETYWLLVSGAGADGFGDFEICIESLFDFNCINDQVISITPPPINGEYLTDMCVEICISVKQPFLDPPPNNDWLHGMVPVLGSGWDVSTIVPTQFAASCRGDGNWGWYETCTGENTNPQNPGTVGPGFFYDSSGGAPLDGIPGNNWGDGCNTGTGSWDFCFKVRTKGPGSCLEGEDLSVQWLNYTDKETGVFAGPINACPDDVEIKTQLALTCCAAPEVLVNQLGCDGVTVSSIEVSGVGVGPFTYTWSTGASETQPAGVSSTISGLAQGIYWVVVEDLDNGCTTQRSYTIDPPSDIDVDAGPIQTVCFGGDATLTPTVSGGNPFYSYSWTSQPAGFTSNLESPTFGPITEPTVFFLEVTDCSLCREYDPVLVNVDMTCGTPLTATFTQVNVLCFGQSTGSIDIIPTGGTPPLQFNWDHGPITEDVTNLPAGPYSVTITDGASQNLTINVTIIQEPQMTVSETVINASCNLCDGSIAVTPNGGTPGYLYSFNGGPFQSPNSWNALCPGPYSVVVQDANLCEQTFNYVINSASLGSTVTSTTLDCFGDLGQIVASGSGGTTPYMYSLDGGPFQLSGTFINVTGGLHMVTTEDATGCQNIQNVTLIEPAELIVDDVATIHNSCFGQSLGQITITLSGGSPPYEYALNGGSFQLSNQFPNLSGGNYIVDIRDGNGCTLPSFNTVINEPPALIISEDVVQTTCGACDGSITLTLSGGTPGYEFSIDGAPFQSNGTFTGLCPNNYGIAMRDANMCGETRIYDLTNGAITTGLSVTQIQCFGELGEINVTANGANPPFLFSLDGGPFQNSGLFTGVAAGPHIVTIEDAVGCQVNESANLIEPAQLNLVSVVEQDVLCNGAQSGQLTITVSGGATPYQYSLDGISFQTSNVFPNLNGGNYNIFIQDANGCDLPGGSVTIDEPSEVIVDETIVISNCGACDGSINLNPAGGVPGYEFSINGQAFQTSGSFINLCPDTYSIIVRDANLCEQTLIYDFNTSAVSSSLVVNDIQCYGELGQIIVEGIGGVPPFSYSLNGGTPQSTGVFTNLPEGIYDILIEDFFGCADQQMTTLTEPDALETTNVSIIQGSCFDSNDGEITVDAQGGTPPYEFALTPGNGFQFSNSFIGLEAQAYELTIRDQQNCDLQFDIQITEPDDLGTVAIQNLSDSYCDNEEPIEFNSSNPEAQITGPGVSAGNSPSSYIFSPGSLTPGTYDITISISAPGNNGVTCSQEAIQQVVVRPTTEASFVGLDDTYCWNNDAVELIGNPIGGIFEGEGIQGDELVTEIASAAGTYDISYIYTNEFGCTDIETQTIEISGPKISIASEIDVNFGDSIILAPALNFDWTVTGIDYNWTPPLYLSCTNCPNPIVKPEKDIIYTVTAMDQDGCMNEQSVRINAVKDFRVFIPNAFTPNGDGRNDILVFNSNWVEQVNYFKVYDRWGQLVFEAINFEPNNEDFGWDGLLNGEELNGGSYVYFTEFKFADGSIKTKSGSIMLLK